MLTLRRITHFLHQISSWVWEYLSLSIFALIATLFFYYSFFHRLFFYSWFSGEFIIAALVAPIFFYFIIGFLGSMSPLVGRLLLFSIAVLTAVVFFCNWTSSGPNLFLLHSIIILSIAALIVFICFHHWASNKPLLFIPRCITKSIVQFSLLAWKLYRCITKSIGQVSPLVWTFLSLSIITLVTSTFFHNWTSSGPTFFLSYEMNPTTRQFLPARWQTPPSANFLEVNFSSSSFSSEVLLPVIISIFFCKLLRFVHEFIHPKSIIYKTVTRSLINFILLLVGLRYFTWRTLYTLNTAHPVSTVFSYFLWAIELITFFSFILHALQTIVTTTDKRTEQANKFSKLVSEGKYAPSVDVFIPTCGESEHIVRRTIIGCQEMRYSSTNKKIYVLDDNNKEGTLSAKIKALTKELGCEYICTPKHKDRKAGNLNYALECGKTHGELIVVMDADFVPYTKFLERTIGFFSNENKNEYVDLVQTPQNPDYHARNLGLEQFLPNDMEHFYGLLQPSRDAHNSVICCGSSYVVRRSTLKQVGNYYVDCCIEDFQTSLKILIDGGKIIYLNETLSMGESTRNFSEFINQRLRWLQGNIQVYFRKEDLHLYKLNWQHKIFLLSQFIHCLQSLIRVVFLITPLLSITLGIAPVLVPLNEAIYYFLPFWIMLAGVYGWGAHYRVSYFWNEIYEIIFCFPALWRLRELCFNLFQLPKTTVTQKQTIKDKTGKKRTSFNFKLTWPLLVLLGWSGVILLMRFSGIQRQVWLQLHDNGPSLLFWMGYNSLMMLIAVLSAIETSDSRSYDRFPLTTKCKATNDLMLDTYDVSEGGACLKTELNESELDENSLPQEGTEIDLEFSEYEFSVKAKVVNEPDKQGILRVEFIGLKNPQRRHLVKILYAEDPKWMTKWMEDRKPGMIDSLLHILSPLSPFKSEIPR
jgi:cellulose synthase (UDP-forming)